MFHFISILSIEYCIPVKRIVSSKISLHFREILIAFEYFPFWSSDSQRSSTVFPYACVDGQMIAGRQWEHPSSTYFSLNFKKWYKWGGSYSIR